MQIAPQTLENTYPTCNYVNRLWLFIQLFTLVFAHAFICHIRGRQWCPGSGRLSPQAVWTDNGQGENPPLQSCAASWPAHSAQHHMEWDCFEEVCTPAHNKVHTHTHVHTHSWPHTHNVHEDFLDSLLQKSQSPSSSSSLQIHISVLSFF